MSNRVIRRRVTEEWVEIPGDLAGGDVGADEDEDEALDEGDDLDDEAEAATERRPSPPARRPRR